MLKSAKSKKVLLKICGFGLLLSILIGVSFYLALPDRTIAQKSEDYKQEWRSRASSAAHLLVLDQITKPETAIHPVFGDPGESVFINGSNHFTISSWVDTQNSSGTLFRRLYTAKVKYLPPKDKWLIISLHFKE